MFGSAGSGKSAFANTIAHRLDVGNEVDLTFYRYERGDPIFSSPVKLFSTIAYRIACKHEEYRNQLLEALSKNDRTPTTYHCFRKRYEQLLGELLPILAQPSRPHVLVIDGLDAYCDSPCLREPAMCILELAKVAPWVKVLATSRTERPTTVLSEGSACVHHEIMFLAYRI